MAMMQRTACLMALLLAHTTPAATQIALSANEGDVKLVDGVVQVQKDGKDTLTLIDLASLPPRVIAELQAPASVMGPPSSIAISPREDIALVSNANKLDPADPTKLAPDNRVTVLDLTTSTGSLLGRLKSATGLAKAEAPKPPAVLATLEVGAAPSGVAINRAGSLALVANRDEGTVSVLAIDGKKVSIAGKIDLGSPKSSPGAVAFTPDGRMALVTRDGDNRISVLSIEGTKVDYTKRDIHAGLRPASIDISPAGDFAIVANIGMGEGDADTLSVIDLAAKPPRVVNTVSAGQTPEAVKLSPDGKYLAVVVMNGSNKASTSPFFKANGVLQIFGRNGSQLSKITEAPTGRWCQGVGWSKNQKTVVVQCMVEEEIQVFRFTGLTAKGLTRSGAVKVSGGPAGLAVASK